ncbi:MAG TPA: type II toxin-antitoxin system RelE/ParE family toxin [Pyrinomonadaceae bacterium]|nr:type II toxin-antitoxin system RelE/ParE family toxin [Pyrinomonadaceae bacterium]
MQKNKTINKQIYRTELSVFAKNDLDEIWSYINQDNSEYADNLIKEFLQKFKLLAENPNLGKSKDKILLNLRCFPFKSYLIFYVPIENGIEIFRVIHTSRNIEGLFEEFFENLK